MSIHDGKDPLKNEMEEYMEYHKQLLAELGKFLELPQDFSIVQCLCRKDIQVLSMSMSVSEWEGFTHKHKIGFSVEQYMPLLMEVIWNFMCKKLEDYYQAKLNQAYLLCPHIVKNTVYLYSVKIFAMPIFKHIGGEYGKGEDRFARILSRHIRDLSGRGPERITVNILGEKCLAICIFGMIPLYVNKYLLANKNSVYIIEDLFTGLIHAAVDHLFIMEYDYIPERLVKINFEQNHIVVLVFTNSAEPALKNEG